jgi:DNA-binding MarR family transcriptional regulator
MSKTESEPELRELPENKLREHHISLLEAISNHEIYLNNKQLAEIVDRAESTVSRHLANLSEANYISKKSDGVNNFYELKQRGENVLRSGGNEFELIDRGHGLMYTFPIKRAPKEGFDRQKFRVNENMSNWNWQLTRDYGSNAVAYINGEKSVSVMIKSVNGRSSEDVVLIGYFIAEDIIRELVQENPGLAIGEEFEGRLYPCEISKQSHAITNESFAKKAAEFNLHLTASDTDSLFEVDQSNNKPEIEFVHKNRAVEDYQRYETFITAFLEDRISVEPLEKLTEAYRNSSPGDRIIIEVESKNQDSKKDAETEADAKMKDTKKESKS